jgi:glycosyltransferase involved in cell wall biosynthesis
MNEWTDKGIVSYLGVSDNVKEEIAKADCVVLPSYREGTPRSLLEAAAMARPVIAADSVGCRNVVDDQITGLLVRVKDPIDLADKNGGFFEDHSFRSDKNGIKWKGKNQTRI